MSPRCSRCPPVKCSCCGGRGFGVTMVSKNSFVLNIHSLKNIRRKKLKKINKESKKAIETFQKQSKNAENVAKFRSNFFQMLLAIYAAYVQNRKVYKNCKLLKVFHTLFFFLHKLLTELSMFCKKKVSRHVPM